MTLSPNTMTSQAMADAAVPGFPRRAASPRARQIAPRAGPSGPLGRTHFTGVLLPCLNPQCRLPAGEAHRCSFYPIMMEFSR